MKKWDRVFLLATMARPCGKAGNSSRVCTTTLISAHHLTKCKIPCANIPDGRRSLHSSTPFGVKKDYYEILGVPRNATLQEIKKAYYTLAKKYHPDANKADAETAKKFTQIGEAYQVLSDEQKRKAYDQSGFSEFSGPEGATYGGDGGTPFTASRAEEIFRQFFGNMGDLGSIFDQDAATSRQQLVLNLSFMEAVKGCTKPVSLRIQDMCTRCSGTGAEPGKKAQTCPYCQGRGEEVIHTGLFHMRSTCRRCHGQGTIVTTPCAECQGTGTKTNQQTVDVTIPAGVSDGMTLRVPVGGRSEVFVIVKVKESGLFERDGYDVHSDAVVSFTQAALGGEVRIQGLNGPMNVKIPAGVQSHHRIRLAGRGIARLDGSGLGDHYVHLKIKIPKVLSDQQKELLVEFARTETLPEGSKVNSVETGSGESREPSGGKREGGTEATQPQGKSILQKLKDVFWSEEDKDSKERQKM